MDPLVIWLREVGPAMIGWALFAVLMGAFVRGRIVFSVHADARVAQAEREADRWHEAFNARGATLNELARQNGQLMRGVQVAVDVAAALPAASERTGT